jgi:hypothetical protein
VESRLSSLEVPQNGDPKAGMGRLKPAAVAIVVRCEIYSSGFQVSI